MHESRGKRAERKCTVRGKHEIYGDERDRLINNKSKYSSFRPKGVGKVARLAKHR